MAEVQKADPRTRRLALAVVAAGFVGGAFLLWGLNAGGPFLERWLREDPTALVFRARMLIAILAIVMAGPPIAAGVYLFRFGARVLESNRFPPPDMRLVEDMLVLTGDPARTRGRIARAAGFVLALAGCAMALLLWRLAAAVT